MLHQLYIHIRTLRTTTSSIPYVRKLWFSCNKRRNRILLFWFSLKRFDLCIRIQLTLTIKWFWIDTLILSNRRKGIWMVFYCVREVKSWFRFAERNKIHAVKLTARGKHNKIEIFREWFLIFLSICGFLFGFSKISCVHTQYFMINQNLAVTNEPAKFESHEMERYDKYFSGNSF